jgi:hypothetical protein
MWPLPQEGRDHSDEEDEDGTGSYPVPIGGAFALVDVALATAAAGECPNEDGATRREQEDAEGGRHRQRGGRQPGS